MKKLLLLVAFISLVSFANAQTAYITNGYGGVSVINLATNTVTDTIGVSSSPNGVSVSPNGSRVYVTDDSNHPGVVDVINTATDTVSAVIFVGNIPFGVTVSPNGNNVYVANYSDNTVSVIDAATNTVTATIPVGHGPLGLSVTPDGSKVYVANDGDSTVKVINTATNTVTDSILVGSASGTVTVSPKGHRVYVGASGIKVINTTTNTVTTTIPDGNGPIGITVSPDGSKVYATNYYYGSGGPGSVIVIDTVTNTIIDSIIVGTWPYGISVTPDGSKVCVANKDDGTVSVINTATNTVTDTITVGGEPLAYGNFIGCNNASDTTAIVCNSFTWYGTTYTTSGTPTRTLTNIAGCDSTITLHLTINPATQTPEICTVTTDSATHYQFNIICWDSTLYSNVDSFIVYRWDVIAASYLRIGAESATGLGHFTDTAFSIGGPNGGNPLYSSWIYKLAIRDLCGNIGNESPYHQTMFVQQSGSNFSWNAYTIESGQNPVIGYSFLRDDNNTGNWHVLVNTAGLSATDPNYASYPNGNWRVDALGFNCTISHKIVNTQTNTKSHSNTIKPLLTGIKNTTANDEYIAIFPNPATDEIKVISEQSAVSGIEIYNMLGEKVYTSAVTDHRSPFTINIAAFPSGFYIVQVKTEKGVAVKKFVKE